MIRTRSLLMLAAALWVTGCGGTASQLQIATLNASVRSSDSVIDVYSRIAQGVNFCWFGSSGFLKATHVFYADVPSSGQSAEIVIHERDTTQPQPWGRRAFRISIARADGETGVEAENVAMKDDVAGRMRADVFQWARGQSQCTPEAPAAAPAAALPSRSWRKIEPGLDPAMARGSWLAPRHQDAVSETERKQA